jgi:hypothetical protein
MALNALQRHILENNLDEIDVMDRLQIEAPFRLISDGCSTAGDVAECDCAIAVEWLKVQAAKDCARRL